MLRDPKGRCRTPRRTLTTSRTLTSSERGRLWGGTVTNCPRALGSAPKPTSSGPRPPRADSTVSRTASSSSRARTLQIPNVSSSKGPTSRPTCSRSSSSSASGKTRCWPRYPVQSTTTSWVRGSSASATPQGILTTVCRMGSRRAGASPTWSRKCQEAGWGAASTRRSPPQGGALPPARGRPTTPTTALPTSWSSEDRTKAPTSPAPPKNLPGKMLGKPLAPEIKLEPPIVLTITLMAGLRNPARSFRFWMMMNLRLMSQK